MKIELFVSPSSPSSPSSLTINSIPDPRPSVIHMFSRGLGLVGKLGETLKMQKLWIAEVEGSKAGAAVAEASKKSRLRECFSHVSTLLYMLYILTLACYTRPAG